MDDDELREWLSRADPSSALGPADPARVTRRLEATMTDSPTPDPRRGTRVLLVAAAAAVVVVAAIGFVLGRGGGDPAPVAAPTSTPTSTPTGAPTAARTPRAARPGVHSLRVSAVVARCAPPSASVLRRQPVAFAGTVVSLASGRAVLQVSRVYAGHVADRVRVAAPDADLQQLIAAVDFAVGRRYLVSADAGQVTVCGYTGPVSATLSALYDQAFPR